MSRKAWDLMKHSKRFYVRVYRKVGTVLLVSVIMNVGLGLAIVHVYFNLPESDFYSTYGETPPVKLTVMNTPNYSSVPLLAADVSTESNVRTIPQ